MTGISRALPSFSAVSSLSVHFPIYKLFFFSKHLTSYILPSLRDFVQEHRSDFTELRKTSSHFVRIDTVNILHMTLREKVASFSMFKKHGHQFSKVRLVQKTCKGEMFSVRPESSLFLLSLRFDSPSEPPATRMKIFPGQAEQLTRYAVLSRCVLNSKSISKSFKPMKKTVILSLLSKSTANLSSPLRSPCVNLQLEESTQ